MKMAMKDELQFKHAPFFWKEEGFNFKRTKKKKKNDEKRWYLIKQQSLI